MPVSAIRAALVYSSPLGMSAVQAATMNAHPKCLRLLVEAVAAGPVMEMTHKAPLSTSVFDMYQRFSSDQDLLSSHI